MPELTRSCLAVFTLVALPAFAASPDPVAAFEKRLPALAGAAGETVGVAVVHVETGRTVTRNPGKAFPTGSVFKLPLALAVLAKADAGALALEETVEVRRQDLRRFGPIEAGFVPGMKLSIGEVLDRMIVESDNTAPDLLFRRIGGPPALKAWLEAHGLGAIDVPLTELELAAAYAGVTGLPPDGACDPACFRKLEETLPRASRDEAARRYEREPPNTATPEALARLLVRLQRGELVSASSTARLLDAMRRCRTGDRRLRALLPPGTPVFDKTGTIGDSINDVGLVTLPDGKGTLAVVVLVRSSARPTTKHEEGIARIARAAFDAFAPVTP